MSDEPIPPGECPVCGRRIDLAVNVCPHCGYDPEPLLEALERGPRIPTSGSEGIARRPTCTSCGTPLREGERHCPHCGKATRVTATSVIATVFGFIAIAILLPAFGSALSCALQFTLPHRSYGRGDGMFAFFGWLIAGITFLAIVLVVVILVRLRRAR